MKFIISKTTLTLALMVAGGVHAAATFPRVETYISSEKPFLGTDTSTAALETEGGSDDGTNENSAEEDAVCETPEEMLTIIQNERDLLEKSRTKQQDKAAEIELAREQLANERRKLETLKTDVTDLLERVEESQSDDLDRLINIYSEMDSDQAANLLSDADFELAGMVLGHMDEGTAAPILAQMKPVRAQAITKVILERSKLPGDQDLMGLQID